MGYPLRVRSCFALLILMACSCAPAVPDFVGPAPPPEPDPVKEAALFAEAVHDCGQDHAAESPIRSDELGEGERMVRVINNSQVAVQARLLDASLDAAVAGTLVVKPGTSAEFYVPEGDYMVRYRHGDTCEVRRGAKLELTGERAGVEISIKPRFEHGDKSRMRKVSEPL